MAVMIFELLCGKNPFYWNEKLTSLGELEKTLERKSNYIEDLFNIQGFPVINPEFKNLLVSML